MAAHGHSGEVRRSSPVVRDDSDHGSPGHVHNDPADRGKRWYETGKGRLVIGTGLLLAAAWAVNYLASEEIANWAFIAACLIGVAPVARRAFSALQAGMPFTIEMLMTIAAVGALFIGAAEEAALVVFLFAVGEVLEGVAANKARDGIRALANLIPKTALVEENGATREVAADTLRIGQRVLVRPGDRIPADGEIVEGTSGVDDSPVTGESMPVTKGPGDAVFAGSINTEAALRVQVTKAAEDNTIARIIKLVEEAEDFARADRAIHRQIQPHLHARHRRRFAARSAGAAAGLWSGVGHLDLSRSGPAADRLPLRAGHLGSRFHRLILVGRGAARAVDEGGCRDRGDREGDESGLRQDRHADPWPPRGHRRDRLRRCDRG